MQENVDKLVAILNQDFGLMDEVHTQGKDIQALQEIKGQRYRMLMDVYIAKELDKIDDWFEKIADSNKVMETLHVEILKLKDQTQAKILEVERHYSDVCLDIFEDYSREKLILVEVVVEKFQKFFEEDTNDDDIRQAFKMEEDLLELDVKLRDFGETCIKVGNYRQKVKDKYEALKLLDVAQVTKIIEKFKGKYPNIALL